MTSRLQILQNLKFKQHLSQMITKLADIRRLTELDRILDVLSCRILDYLQISMRIIEDSRNLKCIQTIDSKEGLDLSPACPPNLDIKNVPATALSHTPEPGANIQFLEQLTNHFEDLQRSETYTDKEKIEYQAKLIWNIIRHISTLIETKRMAP